MFILHHFDHHDGQIPVWAAVEVMSFGTLSKYIKNMNPGKGSPFQSIATFYSYHTPKGKVAVPNRDMLTSWIHVVVVLRNICAHNSRIYNRSLRTKPMLLAVDKQNSQPQHYGLYHLLLAMKYLKPSDQEWKQFVTDFSQLLTAYQNDIDLQRLHLPADWQTHM